MKLPRALSVVVAALLRSTLVHAQSAPDAADAGAPTSADGTQAQTTQGAAAQDTTVALAPLTVDTRETPATPAGPPSTEPRLAAAAPAVFAARRPRPWDAPNWLEINFGVGLGGPFNPPIVGSIVLFYHRWVHPLIAVGGRLGGLTIGGSGNFVPGIIAEPSVQIGGRTPAFAGYLRGGVGAFIVPQAPRMFSGRTIEAASVLVSAELGMQLFPTLQNFGMTFAARIETYNFNAWGALINAGLGGRFH